MTVELKDLSRYRPNPEHDAVIAWLLDRTEPQYEENSAQITFHIKAQVVERIGVEDEPTAAATDAGTGSGSGTKADAKGRNEKDEL